MGSLYHGHCSSQLGAVFSIVGVAANAVSTTINASVIGIDMFSAYVTAGSNEHRDRLYAHGLDFQHRLTEEKAQEQTARQELILEFCSKSPRTAELYQKSYNALQATFAVRKV